MRFFFFDIERIFVQAIKKPACRNLYVLTQSIELPPGSGGGR